MEELLQNPNIFQWEEDENILDLEIEKQNEYLIMQLLDTECPKCESMLVLRGDKILRIAKNSMIEGVHITCKSCKQMWYVHHPIRIPSLEELVSEGNI